MTKKQDYIINFKYGNAKKNIDCSFLFCIIKRKDIHMNTHDLYQYWEGNFMFISYNQYFEDNTYERNYLC